MIIVLRIYDNIVLFGCDDGRFRKWTIDSDETRKEAQSKAKYNVNALCYLPTK
jgi:hypothetical protein